MFHYLKFFDVKWQPKGMVIFISLLFYSLAVGCSPGADFPGTQTNQESAVVLTSETPTGEPQGLPTPTLSPTPVPSVLPSPTGTPAPVEPEGCVEPPEDYTLVHLNGYLFNQRTVFMLERAAERYHGEIDILGYAITQGSYTDAVSASFGTHSGGGAVDLSVMREGTYTVLYEEIEPLIQALRAAGFAAWLRDFDEVYSGSPIHIHAIAIGDRHLSPAAEDQLTGPSGYFRGFTGLHETPAVDRHGGPVICQWMIKAGYTDLRSTVTPLPPSLQE